jgi:hypothetical protein
VVVGLGSDAGNPSSNTVNGSKNISGKIYVYIKLRLFLYMCVYSLVVLSCLFFATILMKPTVVICPDTPLANESLVQSANERSV